MKNIYVSILLLLGTVTVSLAREGAHSEAEGKKHIHGVHEECELPSKTDDIIKCALEFHPGIKKGNLNLESSAMLEDKASQLPNPTLSARYLEAQEDGVDSSELETNLTFEIELGGKRSSRKEYAKAAVKEAMANTEVTKAEVKIETILNLYRLRQILDEKKVLEEALSAFKKVIGQLRKLPRLSAEQEASLTLFEIAYEETKVNASELYEEERKVEHFFHIATGHSLSEIEAYLPSTPTKWRKLTDTGSSTSSPEVKRLKSLSQLAAIDLEHQKSQAWPNLQIGPSLNIERDGTKETTMIGLNVAIPIPLFQVNGGGKEHARSELIRAQKNVELTQAEENHERFEQLKVYESAVRILEKTMKQREIEKKHTRIEKLYLRGVVSSSVFLESLKQKLSYLRSRNHRELTAVKSLWNIPYV